MKEEVNSIMIICSLGVLGLVYGVYCIFSVILVTPQPKEKKQSDEESNPLNNEKYVNRAMGNHGGITQLQCDKLKEVSDKIAEGANVFLLYEYCFLMIFVIFFGSIIFYFTEHYKGVPYTTVAFVTGALTSILCGFIGMKIATASNYRTAYKAYEGLGPAFKVAYQGGCVLGFILVSLSLLILMALIVVYQHFIITAESKPEDYRILFEAIAGYGLGGSSVALFCRVGGGIYTKAADVGADLVAKLEYNLEEDDPKNPACIADNVGDNVGDIAGMGSDLFGSLAESTCAALVIL
jgi:H(+)-translocating pyrophosphatase